MSSTDLQYRTATAVDVPAMEQARAPDHAAGPADHRMARYLDGEHHPQKALALRVAFVATAAGSVVGYVAGHQSERYGLDGELQYLYVVPGHRRSGVVSALVRLLAQWFGERGIRRVCVAVDEDNVSARQFFAHHGAVDLNESFLHWRDFTALGQEAPDDGA